MDFEPNSHKYKMDKIAKDAMESAEPEEKKFEKVVTGNVKTRKRGLGKRFVDIFLTEDVGDVKTYRYAVDLRVAAADKQSRVVKIVLRPERSDRVQIIVNFSYCHGVSFLMSFSSEGSLLPSFSSCPFTFLI